MMSLTPRWAIVLLLSVGLVAHVEGQRQRQNRGGGSRQPVQTTAHLDVPAHPFDVILGRPTATSVTASVMWYDDTEGFLAYGTQAGKLDARTPSRAFKKGEPAEIVMPGLRPDTRYYYQVQSARTSGGESTFHTARPSGSAFSFTVTADSHLDDRTDPAVYQQTLANALADKPDFHVDLGDTFMTDKHASRENAARQYLAQRYFFGQLAQSVPLLLALGNHDGEKPRGRNGSPDDMAAWANALRTRYFPNPVPGDFYSGNGTRSAAGAFLENYYAWEWGGALFVVLDPFRSGQPRGGQRDNWTTSLGLEQYRWLTRTLEGSKARFRFVFVHNLVGGADDQGRGGAEEAAFYEWGGKNADGTEGFAAHRPGWTMPIHQLFVKHGVSIVFHGHDHFYAKQDLDGIVYQEVPQPGNPGSETAPRSAAEYGYRGGILLGGSGHMRMTVKPDAVTAEYVRVSGPQNGRTNGAGGQVAHSYSVSPR